MSRKAPSLVKLCAGTVIANLEYVGDVSGIDLHLLKDILCHCTVDQLTRIENSTEDVDLSPVTNDLWKRLYEKHFGEENVKLVIRRMKEKRVVFKWRKLYEAKAKEREVFKTKSFERIKRRYEEELAKKQSKQIRICSKIPPSGNKRSFSSVSSSCSKVSHIKGNLMKKARLEYLKSKEACIHATMRKNMEQRKSLPVQSLPHSSKPISCAGKTSASAPALSKSFSSRR
ncbi:uncharacterized protein LOC110021541 [Phalaenopsis equestris]|uniref:uncharacterized protein LOC110021541 n=1 Tax=Phalaenopsis equestris TaxID=78828 RepID=UPI0009E2572B|nr:uncharacterized protein LOC110021541 [Phalaenopsis equestris]XP_020575737.1 uncharacterized protein LOC110021541 [Phalaenopsis equestris]XP_020575738.1 uncharacterized protein LOC110021541 [Phalaenopsis equestris]